jgi:integrase
MKVPEKLPVVLSPEEVAAFFSSIGILKHRAVLMLCYGSGLRISEAVAMKVSSIDSARMLIRVEQGKGAKDRYTILSGRMLLLLREYYKIQRPKQYLFPGTKAGTHISRPPSMNCAGMPAGWPELPNASPHTCCGTASRRICWKTVRTRALSKCCSDTAGSRPPHGIRP